MVGTRNSFSFLKHRKALCIYHLNIRQLRNFTGRWWVSLANDSDDQVSREKVTGALFSSKVLFIKSPPTRSRKGYRIMTVMVVLSKINLLNETYSLLSSQESND
jgi:hypothetical protein